MTGNFDNLFEQLLTALQTAEKRHRAVRDSASDNSDWSTYDSEGELISNIIKWRRSLEPLRTEIVASGAIADVDAPILPTPILEKPISPNNDNSTSVTIVDEKVKVGKYVQAKLHELSESGFVFTQEQIFQMCDLDWSRRTFTYDRFLPFAKLVNPKQGIREQAKDENDKNEHSGYYYVVFKFGKIKLLIVNGWTAKDKDSFDKWYESLLQMQTTVASGTLVFKKTVDWSTLNYGISVPVANWDLFFSAIGQTVSVADSCNISIEVNDSEAKDFKASVIHTASGATNSLQIRYTQVSEIVAELRRIFKNTFDYCNHERSSNSENTRVFIPSELEEYIDIYATGAPNLLRFICSPLKTPTTVQTSVQTESVVIHAKQQFNGDNIVEVSTSFVPVLSFPDRNIVISAKLVVETRQVSFRAEVLGVPYPEKTFKIDYLQEIALLESNKRIHRVAVPENVNASKHMMFMAWIEPLESSIHNGVQEICQPETEPTTTRTKPTKITLLGKEYPVRAWNEMFIKVCEVMLLHSPYIMAAMNKDTDFNTEQRTNFSYIQSEIKINGKRLSNGLWVETNMNNQETLKRSRKLLEKCGFSLDELQVETVEVI